MRCKKRPVGSTAGFYSDELLPPENATATHVSLHLLPKAASRVLVRPLFPYGSLEPVIRFRARPRLPVWLLTAVRAGHVIVEVNDWDFLERSATNHFQRTTLLAFGLRLLYSILRSQRRAVSRAGSSAAALSFAVCHGGLDQTTDPARHSSKAHLRYTSQGKKTPHKHTKKTQPPQNSLAALLK